MSESDPFAPPASAPKVEEAKPLVQPTVTVEEKAPEKPVDAPQTEEATVPEGSIKEVLGWVGDDATKAQQALKAEKAGEKRTTLVSKLEALIN